MTIWFVYQFDAAASRTSGSQSPSPSVTFALASGNTNPQGIADPPPSLAGAPPSPPSQASNDSTFDSALLAIVVELDGWLGGGKRRK